ncbi:MAG: SusD/RagB family nutrient-binding outer membrane lipoprotein [Chitinophagaceae bacterium]|nr:SusD/RagB family nutrient-binding outer membrane lipoprotein [Chitinophagaceae bacterium]
MKKTLKILLTAFILPFLISCSKFGTINTDPNVPSTVTPDLLLQQIEVGSFRFWNPNPNDFSTGNLFAKHTVILATNPNPYQYYYSYWPYGSFDAMINLTDLKRMVELSSGQVDSSSYKGIALFMKAWYGFQMTLDMGDIPYSQAGGAENGNFTPKYDKQQDVLNEILADLQSAEQEFANGRLFSGDIMYNGDPVKWRHLCNAMQLKVLQVFGKKITNDQKARFAAIVSAGNLLTEDDNFQLVYSANSNASHPFYNGESQRILIAPSDLVVNFLKQTQDRRLFYFAEPAPAQITGGLSENDYNAYAGAPTQLSATQLALNRQSGIYSLINKRYVAFRDGDPMLIFTYSEQCFIIAEAIEEGWLPGSAQTYYENGVKAILNYYMNLSSAPPDYLHGMPITQNYIDNYFTGAAAYNTAGTTQDRIKQIVTQRWLLDYFQGNALFSYKTFLRTGYPQFPLDPSTSMNPENPAVYPKRWKYPPSELTTNPVNYNKAIQDQYGGFDGIDKVPWWLQ